ncbi:hypothetical protein [Bacillus sp. PS06]|nr:hypothetical protein [Bacillus sp. PS06]MBD8067641.1 hypothetical protein [Bacillus sp. PS06]
MSETQVKITNDKESLVTISGYKVIEFNVSDPTESLYAVVTPIKNTK